MHQRMEEILNNLVEAFKDSQEYKEYQRMKDLLAQEPEKEKAVNEFRKRNFELHKYRNTDLYNEMDRLENEFAPLREQAFVNEFLAAELAVCRMVQRINYRLMEEIDFELGFEHL